jgi:hypothetical protein
VSAYSQDNQTLNHRNICFITCEFRYYFLELFSMSALFLNFIHDILGSLSFQNIVNLVLAQMKRSLRIMMRQSFQICGNLLKTKNKKGKFEYLSNDI